MSMFRFKNKSWLVFILLILAFGLIFIWQYVSRTIEISEQPNEEGQLIEEKISPLSGLACQNYQRRPLAVVLAEDPVTRPLAGLSQADLVLEMPVITNSITRMLAVYLCQEPPEIGSLRSARHDFVPLILGLDAILVHWGGSHFALDKLNTGILDNIDALENPYNAFYQKQSIPQPHNGFTSMERLLNSAQKLGYRLENQFEGYPFRSFRSKAPNNRSFAPKVLKIGYSYPYNVSYQYEPATNSYLRYRTNLKEIDKNNNQQIEAKNVVVMRVFSRQIEWPDYNDLDLEGSGQCQVYQNGTVIDGTWQKSEKNPASKLKFLDEAGQEIPFVPGQIWLEIIEPEQEVTWQ
ncbi:MAG: hypothetical protein COS49_01560 [Candidatus Portnoybacteria bacterium CG03_land_8_20_14_0_80_41_10]|uniref:DUF3048 domain-containing protein n=1 Tax=Candidatus Portnoybacteria bacterium CG03_land_8_20_14_0_80_41_10 TaxID=1974808 RepID=A0A2M7BUN5_9BACT|nr:MAG: hypothetical protein COS49_01560 [Candidatus Portnoybacteria bacterium CG03_land_8_20_14_0_80_41_10]